MTDQQLAIRQFESVRKALYELVGLFITGPLKGYAKEKTVRQAIAALAQVAKDRTGR